MTVAAGQRINAADILAIQVAATTAATVANTAQTSVATAQTTATGAATLAMTAAAAANAAANTISPGALPNLTVAANVSGGPAAASPVAVTTLLDRAISAAVGGILFRSSAGWTALPPGIAGQVLQSGGLGNPPNWITLPTIPATTATAPGGATLTFGTATSSTQPLTINAATGTVTSYQMRVSTSAAMTFPANWSAIGTNLTPLISGLQPSTVYYYTITAYNGSTPGTTSAVQNHATAAAVTVPPVTPNVSPSGTIVSTVGPIIFDANGVSWAINGSGQVTVNGVADSTTANVIKIAYFSGFIYQENASLLWWFKTLPTDNWVQTTDPTAVVQPPVVQDPTGTGTVLPGGSTNPPVVVPLTGTVSPVTKVYKTYNGMGYILIPPANYNPSRRYPILLYLHQDDQGNPYYTNGGQGGDIVGPQIDPWFNNVGFLTKFSCFTIALLNNQTTQAYDGQINFGGYGNGTQVSQTNGIAIIKQIIAQYPIDTSRIYCTGNSMGGTGTIVQMVLNNTINGTQGKVFAAGLALSAVDYDDSASNVVNSSVVTQFMAGVPLISIHGASDTEQPANRFSLPLFNQLGGTGGNAAGMALSRAGSSKYYLLIDSQQGHNTWDIYYVWPRAQPYFQQLFGYEATGTVAVSPPATTASANNTIVTTVGSALTDAAGNTWTISVGALMALNGTALSNTANVTKLAYVNGTIWQQNAAGNWYSVVSVDGSGLVTFSEATTVSPLTTPITMPVGPGTGAFRCSNGLIIDPNGNSFVARGINVYDSAQSDVVSNTACQPLLTLFPGLNFIRLPCYSYDPPSSYATFISRCTARGIVVLIEHHVAAGGGVPPLTGSDLTAENAWFAALATYYAANKYVWFGTLNEPGGPGSDLTAEQVSNYSAIRGTGNSSIIVFQTLGDYATGVLVVGAGHGLTSGSYAGMTNIVWDMHIYNGLPHFSAGDGVSYSTNQAQLNNMVANYMTQSQTIHSADGVPPVMILEYGISTADDSPDPGGTQTCIAVQQSGKGCAAWNWFSGGGLPDCLTDGSNNLTSYGRQVAGWIASAAA